MAPTRRPSDELRLQKDEADSPLLFAEEQRPVTPSASRDPIPDPMDDFRMIEPAAVPLPTGPRASLRAKRPTGASSSPTSRRPAPEAVVPRKWLLPVGIGLTVLAVVVPLVAVLLTGSTADDNSSLPPYTYNAPFQSRSMPVLPTDTTFPRVYTPGEEPEPKIGEVVAVEPNPFDFVAPIPVAPSPSSERLAIANLAKGEAPAFRPVSPSNPLEYTGRAIEVFDSGSPSLVDVCIGGHGRYLFATAPTKADIFVIDLTTGRLERTIPFPAAQFSTSRIAAGADTLVAVDASNGVATSWKIGDFDAPIATVDLKLPGIGPILMGSETNGPLVVTCENPLAATVFLDPTTLKSVKYNFDSRALAVGFVRTTVRSINSTGTLLSSFALGARPQVQFWTIGADAIARKAVPGNPIGRAVPALSPGGDHAMTIDREHVLSENLSSRNSLPYSALSTRNYSIETTDPTIVSHTGPGEIDLWKVDGREPFASLKNDVAAAELIARTPALRPRNCEGIWCVGRSNVVVLKERGRLLFWHANPANQKPAATVQKAPPANPFDAPKSPAFVPGTEGTPRVIGRQGRTISAIGGEKFLYREPVYTSQNYKLKYEIIKGPVGMKIDETGRIEWATPEKPDAMEYEVVVRICDEDKKFDLTDAWKLKVVTRPKPK